MPFTLGGLLGGRKKSEDSTQSGDNNVSHGPPKWSMGVLNDTRTIEVPGSVLLLANDRNEPLGLNNAPARESQSSLPLGSPWSRPGTPRRGSTGPSAYPAPAPTTKKTGDGKIILDPQPEDSANDPLNWPSWRRDCALLSLGFYCMVGGGITPLLAAGFPDVAHDYDVEVETVALTTGLYMMGLGLGSVIASPTAILYGKRPVYLVSAFIFIASCVWCALSPSFASLVVARVFQGLAVSPVECLPSATIAEIFFLHERAFRIGIYTLLLLGGKNLVPLISAVVIQNLGWRWVFWVVAIVVGFSVIMLFFFVPESFWDRTPVPRSRAPSRRPSFVRRLSSRFAEHRVSSEETAKEGLPLTQTDSPLPRTESSPGVDQAGPAAEPEKQVDTGEDLRPRSPRVGFVLSGGQDESSSSSSSESRPPSPVQSAETPGPSSGTLEQSTETSVKPEQSDQKLSTSASLVTGDMVDRTAPNTLPSDPEKMAGSDYFATNGRNYTTDLRSRPAQTFVQQLRPYHGRLSQDSWLKVMIRPFILFCYPSILWSAAVYACSVGWLIVISESMAMIYQDRDSYNFDAFQTGLVYVSPFVGGLLGTAVAGKVSDIIVKAMARRNGGLYEPGFRLVMAIPILITTVIGLMGFGWSAEERDHWMVPTFFFGVISFGCSLGSTTSITFCVDSYRQYAGEALVTLNFSKNVLHGLVFSLFFTHWLSADGSKMVFIWTGVIQLILMLTTIPLYIYGKRGRMWTVRMNLVERFSKW